MVARNRQGFTLIEVIVVVVIIGTIVALLVPAVLASRGRARVVQCTNNQTQLATAMLGYETAKNRLPGYVNPIRTVNPEGTSAVTWAPLLLPYLSRNDLWEGTAGAKGWQTGDPDITIQNAVIGMFLCPDQVRTSTYTLSYVLNVGIGNPPPVPTLDPATETGPFCNRVPLNDIGTASRSISLSDISSTAQRPMLSESVYQASSSLLANRVWGNLAHADGPATPPPLASTALTPITVNLTPAQLGFVWPATTVTVGSAGVLPPIHPGIVIVTFCDGSVRSLSADTDCSVYASSAIP